MKKQLVVLGTGEAVHTCLREVLRHPNQFEITVFGEEAVEILGWYEANGIHARLGNHATQIDLNSRTVIDGEGWTMPFDTLLLAGAVANVELARKAGIKVHRGIVVNDHLKTSDPNVFAAGECAEFKRHRFGAEERLTEQAEVFAAAMSGESGPALLALSAVHSERGTRAKAEASGGGGNLSGETPPRSSRGRRSFGMNVPLLTGISL